MSVFAVIEDLIEFLFQIDRQGQFRCEDPYLLKALAMYVIKVLPAIQNGVSHIGRIYKTFRLEFTYHSLPCLVGCSAAQFQYMKAIQNEDGFREKVTIQHPAKIGSQFPL